MKNRRPFIIAVALLLFAGIAPAVSAQTALVLPDLTGPYQVSRTNYDLTDQSRDEIFTEDPSDKREILVTVYYPAQPAVGAQTAPYMDQSLQQATTKQNGVPDFLLNISTHTYADQPAAPGKYPVLIFSPGFGTLTAFYTSLLEDMASHGYIVAALWHPYSTGLVEFSDGRIVATNEAGGTISPDTGDALLKVWLGDALFTLNTLETLNQTDARLAGHMDLDHVGAFGHSFGGATAAEMAHDDERVAAAANLDGTMFGQVARSGLMKPLMMMQSETNEVTLTDAELASLAMTRAQYDRTTAAYTRSVNTVLATARPGFQVRLTGSMHNSYATDLLTVAKQYSAIIGPSQVGTLDPDRAFTLIRSAVRSFFDQQLKGQGSGVLETLSGDAAVVLKVYNAP